MKIINLTENSNIYTSNVYLVLGDRNSLNDTNTLVDVGRDPSIINKISKLNTGVGKHKIDQVVLTHHHFDHVEILPLICKTYHPKVYAFSSHLHHVDNVLENGELLKIGDRLFEVIHMPGHSRDSICLYNEEEGVLFSGDSPVIIMSVGYTYESDFQNALELIGSKNVRSIYPGHGQTETNRCNEMIATSIQKIEETAQLNGVGVLRNKASMEAKGLAIWISTEFVRQKFPSAYNDWIASLSDKSKAILVNIDKDAWYPVQESLIEPIEQICKMFYNGNEEGAIEVGRFSTDYMFRGIYKIFLKLGSTKCIINKASSIFSRYYRPCEMKLDRISTNSAVAQIFNIPNPHRLFELRIAAWIQRALELNKCVEPKVDITRSHTKGDQVTDIVAAWK